MNSPIRIFVCGTYKDLSEERGRVLDALQRLQLPSRSMELFGARPERPIETCLTEVRKSDVLVVIVDDLYGTLVPGRQISYSEAEYQEAYSLKKPCLVYIRKDSAEKVHLDKEDLKMAGFLGKWKSTLRDRHTVYPFQDGNDLALQVLADLHKLLTSEEMGGKFPKISRQLPNFQPTTPKIRVRSSLSFGDEARQLLHGLAIDGRGNIVIVGDFWGSIDFGGSRLTSAGDRDIFIAKFNNEGKLLWSKRYGDASEQVGVGVAIDGEGNLFVVSAFTGTLSFGGDLLVSKGLYNMALAKLDPSGKHIWSRSFGDMQYHVPECIAVGSSGNILVAGRFQGALDLGGYVLESTSRQTDIFIVSFSSDGECYWAKKLGGPFEQQARSLAIGEDGTIALTGVFKGLLRIDNEILNQDNPEDYCGFLVTFDQIGGVLWCKRFGEPHVEQGSVVTFDVHNGDLLVAGFIRNKLPVGIMSQADSICLFARYDPTGILKWSKTFRQNAFTDSISVNPHGNILLSGHFQGSVDLGEGELVSAGGYDIFVATFTADGNLICSERFGDKQHQFLVKGAYGVDGAIILGGSFHGTIDFGNGPLIATGYDGVNEGAEDIFLAILEDQAVVSEEV